MTKIYDAANWSKHEDDFTQMFYNQNVKQFWLPEEIALNGDLPHLEVPREKRARHVYEGAGRIDSS